MENNGLEIARWILENPEKVALFLVLLAGAWRWLKELRTVDRKEDTHDDFLKALLEENRSLRTELREERKRSRRPAGADENSGRNA